MDYTKEIHDYINGELKGEELKDFEKKLKNPEFALQIDTFKGTIKYMQSQFWLNTISKNSIFPLTNIFTI